MEEFIVSARKYRPATFDTVVGQLNITTTLKNSIKNNHLGHAYLFCGPRGVGKTTCARIFAKTINCQNLNAQVEACDKCDSCKSFNESASYNIHELDAASNNSVEDIRTLIDQVRISPQVGKYSIYIIDEVHMLSAAAFNAFLKTLEEPPKHAIFILATTEKHKILPTILSRCQIFDFNRIKVEDTVSHLESVAKKEGIEVDVDALNVIALKADGGMRDALSIFDQVVSFSGQKLTYQNTIENLNVLDYEYFFKLTDAFLSEDYKTSLLVFDKILEKGFDGHNFINGLCAHFRDLLVAKDVVTLKLLEVGAAIREKYKTQSEKTSVEFLYQALDIGNKSDINYKASKNQRLHVELTLLQFCNISKKKIVKEPAKAPEETSAPIVNTHVATKVVPAEPKVVAKTYSSTGLSLNDVLSGQKVVANTPKKETPTVESPKIIEARNDFSNDDLIIAWKKYAAEFEIRQPRIFGILTASTPEKAGDTVRFTLFAETQIQVFRQEIRLGLLRFLQEQLQNGAINIEVVEGKQEEMIRKPYSSKERYDFLIEQNPLLDKLREEFDLGME